MNQCKRCFKVNPAEIHTCSPWMRNEDWSWKEILDTKENIMNMTADKVITYKQLHIDEEGYLIQTLEVRDEDWIRLEQETYAIPLWLDFEGLKRID